MSGPPPGRARRHGRAAHHPPVQAEPGVHRRHGRQVRRVDARRPAHQALARARKSAAASIRRPSCACRTPGRCSWANCRRGRRALAHLRLRRQGDSSNAGLGDPPAGRLAGRARASPVVSAHAAGRGHRRGDRLPRRVPADLRPARLRAHAVAAEAEDRQARACRTMKAFCVDQRAPATSSTCAASTGTPDAAWWWSASDQYASRTSCRSTPATNCACSSLVSCADVALPRGAAIQLDVEGADWRGARPRHRCRWWATRTQSPIVAHSFARFGCSPGLMTKPLSSVVAAEVAAVLYERFSVPDAGTVRRSPDHGRGSRCAPGQSVPDDPRGRQRRRPGPFRRPRRPRRG